MGEVNRRIIFFFVGRHFFPFPWAPFSSLDNRTHVILFQSDNDAGDVSDMVLRRSGESAATSWTVNPSWGWESPSVKNTCYSPVTVKHCRGMRSDSFVEKGYKRWEKKILMRQRDISLRIIIAFYYYQQYSPRPSLSPFLLANRESNKTPERWKYCRNEWE